MTTPRRRGKPTALSEVLRTLAVWDLLHDGLKQRINPQDRISFDAALAGDIAILAIAERIAARTEDDE